VADTALSRKLHGWGQLRRLPPPIFAMVTTENFQGRFFFGF
jgi:hypothetical protein